MKVNIINTLTIKHLSDGPNKLMSFVKEEFMLGVIYIV